jgi:UDP-glucose 4-epimerase/dTDP-L-rhamnose 4-epimerase
MPPGDPLGGCAGTSLIQRVLGWQPGISIEDGVARYVNWLKSTPAALPEWLRREARQGA